jgi:predicted SAM-dependent methyltransferase
MSRTVPGISSQLRDGVARSKFLGSLSWKFQQISNRVESKWRLIEARGPTKQFTFPICSFEGRFVSDRAFTGQRYAAMCPKCGSAERHRLQYLAVRELKKSHNFSELSLLHIAPEEALGSILRTWFGKYTTADISSQGVDLVIDLTSADLPDASYDVVYASHVLEHITEDTTAIKEIARILRPGGFAVLPVPLVGDVTIEYPAPVATEFGHVRAPGYDYYERYSEQFSHVKTFSSEDFDECYQVYVYEDRSRYPTVACPYRIPSKGARHKDVVPVAYV